MRGQAPNDGFPPFLWALLASLAVLLLGFSQTVAFFGDEGFHLLAARLVNAGKRMYLDFFYPHAPLYVYLIAAWMRVIGDTWRSVHAFSALLTSASTVLVTWYVFSRSRESGWQRATATAAALLMGLNSLVIWYGTIAQAYGLALFLTVAAFLLTISSVARVGGLRPFLAGVCAGSAAASLLLTTPVAPILLLWLFWHPGSEHRFTKGAYFLAGTGLPFLPLLWPMGHEPGTVLFDVAGYHLFYRATWVDRSWSVLVSLRTLAAWLNSTQALLLVLLAAIGLTTLACPSAWDDRRRREFRLCGGHAAGQALFLALPLPTLPHYFILVVPFVSILAAVGINVLGARVWPSVRPLYVTLPVLVLFTLGLAKVAVQARGTFSTPTWGIVEDLARKVNRVTPRDGLVHAPEVVLVAAGRLPPPGMENNFGPILRLAPEQLAGLHIVPESQIDTWLATGHFYTVLMVTTDRRVESLGLLRRYARQEQLHHLYILSDPVQETDRSGLRR